MTENNPSTDPIIITMLGIQLVNTLAKIIDPNYQPPTPDQVKKALEQLEKEPDLLVYSPQTFIDKLRFWKR